MRSRIRKAPPSASTQGYAFCGKLPIAAGEPNHYHSVTMPALVIKSFPEALHAKFRQIAAAHRRSVTQETIHLLETAIAVEEKNSSPSDPPTTSYWANRKLLPEYEALMKSGALNSNDDCSIGLSEDRREIPKGHPQGSTVDCGDLSPLFNAKLAEPDFRGLLTFR